MSLQSNNDLIYNLILWKFDDDKSENSIESGRLFLRQFKNFLFALTGIDKYVDEEEIKYINSLLYRLSSENMTVIQGWNLDAENARYINELLYGSKFDKSDIISGFSGLNRIGYMQTIPNSFENAVELDYQSSKTYYTEAFIDLYERAGIELISCDNDTDHREIELFTKYIYRLKEYAEVHLPNISFEEEDKKVTAGNQKRNNVGNSNEIKIREERKHLYSNPGASEKDEQTSRLEIAIKELHDLIGLDTVKTEVISLVNLIKIRELREKRGIRQPPLSLHLVFSGNPGTGKTSVARILSKIYKELGILSKGHLVEVDRSGLVAGFIGQTALKTKEKIEEAIGGVLFIDEAYSLVNESGQDYGKESIDTLLKAMEDRRDDLVVIVAGYTNLMESFLNSNPGLRSRFNTFIKFDDYSENELYRIFLKLCKKNGFSCHPDCKDYLKRLFSAIYAKKSSKGFANGRTVRNFFEKVITMQANRLASNAVNMDDSALMRFELDDLKSAVQSMFVHKK